MHVESIADPIPSQRQISYCVAKKLAEKTLWKFIEEEKPSFTVTNFMPPLIFGPMLQKVPSVGKINFSNAQFHSIMNSAKAEGRKVPSTMFPGYVSRRVYSSLQRRRTNCAS